MTANHLEEFEFSQGGLHIRMKRALARNSAHAPAPDQAQGEMFPQGDFPAEASAPPPAKPAAPKEELHLIKSPIVGTFYSSPSPDAPPFVSVGDTIQAGQVVCIVEAMKLMNEIEADMGGEIVNILAENGQPVEYGQALFAIRPAGKKK